MRIHNYTQNCDKNNTIWSSKRSALLLLLVLGSVPVPAVAGTVAGVDCHSTLKVVFISFHPSGQFMNDQKPACNEEENCSGP
jgi:hypothetical protein